MLAVMLVSLAQAKQHLRIDTYAGDANLELLILAASQAVLTYLKTPDAYQDSSGLVPVDTAGDPLGVPAQVQAAVLLMLGTLDRDRAGVDGKEWDSGYLPRPVISLLYPLRDPSVA